MLKAIKKDLMTMHGKVFDTYDVKPLDAKSDTVKFIEFLQNNFVEIHNLFGRYNYEDFVFGDYENKSIDEKDSINSYNWNGLVIFQARFFEYKGNQYTAINFHRFGDVRGNYTKYAILDCTAEEFYNTILEFEVTIPCEKWNITQNLLDETGYIHAWNNESDEYFEGYYEHDDAPEEVKTAVNNWI